MRFDFIETILLQRIMRFDFIETILLQRIMRFEFIETILLQRIMRLDRNYISIVVLTTRRIVRFSHARFFHRKRSYLPSSSWGCCDCLFLIIGKGELELWWRSRKKICLIFDRKKIFDVKLFRSFLREPSKEYVLWFHKNLSKNRDFYNIIKTCTAK